MILLDSKRYPKILIEMKKPSGSVSRGRACLLVKGHGQRWLLEGSVGKGGAEAEELSSVKSDGMGGQGPQVDYTLSVSSWDRWMDLWKARKAPEHWSLINRFERRAAATYVCSAVSSRGPRSLPWAVPLFLC